MKSLIFLGLLSLVSAANANQVLTCKSADFNPSNYDGQSLKINVDNSLNLVSVEKVEGSWFCDQGSVLSPKLLSSNGNAKVYDVNFKCDELNGRVILSKAAKISSITYEFTYSTDDKNEKYSAKLTCK
jgi:hypothetical protein